MKCNRTACKHEHDGWWNRITEAYYCTPCARRINESSVQSGMGEICERREDKGPIIAGVWPCKVCKKTGHPGMGYRYIGDHFYCSEHADREMERQAEQQAKD